MGLPFVISEGVFEATWHFFRRKKPKDLSPWAKNHVAKEPPEE